MIRFIRSEIKQFLSTKTIVIFLCLIASIPLLVTIGLFGIFKPEISTTLADAKIYLPAKTALYIGSFCTLFMTLYALQKSYRKVSYTLLESAGNPAHHFIAQIIALLFLLILSCAASILLLLPYTALCMGSLFQSSQFLRIWAYIYVLGLVLILLLSSGIYLFTRNVEITFILIIIGVILGIPRISEETNQSNFLNIWLETIVTGFSDGYAGEKNFALILYTRCFWLLLSLGLLSLGLLSVRRYGKNLFGSIFQNVKKVYLFAPLILVLISIYLLSINQPFFTRSSIDMQNAHIEFFDESGAIQYDDDMMNTLYENYHLSTYNADVEILSSSLAIKVHKDRLYVTGKTTHTIRCEKQEQQPITFSLPLGLDVTGIYIDGKSVSYHKLNYSLSSTGHYAQIVLPAPFDSVYLEMKFAGRPLADVNTDTQAKNIATDYTNLFIYPHLLASTKVLRETQNEFFTVSVDESKEFFTAGCLLEEIPSTEQGYRTYQLQMIEGNFVGEASLIIGDYVIERFSVGALDVELYYFKNKRSIYAQIDATQYIKNILAYNQEKYGELVLQDGKPLTIIETDMQSYTFFEGSTCYIDENALLQMYYASDNEAKLAEGVLAERLVPPWWGYITNCGVPLSGYGPLTPMANIEKCFAMLYMRDAYGQACLEELYLVPMQTNLEKLNQSFYWNHKQFAPLLPMDASLELYFTQGSSVTAQSAPLLFFELEAMAGKEVWATQLKKVFEEHKGTLQIYEMRNFLLDLGIEPPEVAT